MSVKKVLASITTAAVALVLASCSSTPSTPASSPDSESAGSGAASTSVEKVKIVASTNVWGSVAESVGKDHVDVTSIVSSPDQDPHDYESTAQDKLAFNDAKIVIVNGGGYDDWATQLAESASEKPTLIDAVETSGLKKADDEDFNEHVFFSLETAKKVADEVVSDLKSVDANNASEYDANKAEFDKSIENLLTAAKTFKDSHPDMTAIATEPVLGYLLADMGIEDITPDRFVEDSETEAGPSAQVVTETTQLLTAKEAKLLVLNGQTEDAVSQKLKETADSAGVPIAQAWETFPEGVTTYVDFVQKTMDGITSALK